MSIYQTSRVIAASPAEVFAAIGTPERLALWWGPEGFRNSFSLCEFKPGGRWVFTMHGPDGTDYPNENRFVDIQDGQGVVIEHLSVPHFQLRIELAPVENGTLLRWTQSFDDPAMAAAIEHIIVPANEQNLDRLSSHLKAALS